MSWAHLEDEIEELFGDLSSRYDRRSDLSIISPFRHRAPRKCKRPSTGQPVGRPKEAAKREEAIGLIQAHLPLWLVAMRVGVSRASVSRWAKSAGFTFTRGQTPMTGAREAAVKLLREGTSIHCTARAIGVAPGTISTWKREAGLAKVRLAA